MQIDFQDTKLKGCKYGKLKSAIDSRGIFTKMFQQSKIEEYFPTFKIAESYITKSKPGVLRGMHLQLPPADHEKIVICLEGHILDVVLDLRNNEEYGSHDQVSLSANSHNLIVIPKGVAHGFYAYEFSTLLYLVSTEHVPENDAGVKWDSFKYSWPSEKPILSERDITLPELKTFNSPF